MINKVPLSHILAMVFPISKTSRSKKSCRSFLLAMCDEISSSDWAVALQQLLEVLNDVSKKVKKSIVSLIKSQLQYWISELPSYIKAYLPNLCCES